MTSQPWVCEVGKQAALAMIIRARRVNEEADAGAAAIERFLIFTQSVGSESRDIPVSIQRIFQSLVHQVALDLVRSPFSQSMEC